MFCFHAASGPEQTQTDDTEATVDTEEDNPEDPRSLIHTHIHTYAHLYFEQRDGSVMCHKVHTVYLKKILYHSLLSMVKEPEWSNTANKLC